MGDVILIFGMRLDGGGGHWERRTVLETQPQRMWMWCSVLHMLGDGGWMMYAYGKLMSEWIRMLMLTKARNLETRPTHVFAGLNNVFASFIVDGFDKDKEVLAPLGAHCLGAWCGIANGIRVPARNKNIHQED